MPATLPFFRMANSMETLPFFIKGGRAASGIRLYQLVLTGGRRRRGRGLPLLQLLRRRCILCDCRRLLRLWRRWRSRGARIARTGTVENLPQLLRIDLWFARTGDAIFVGNDVGVR